MLKIGYRHVYDGDGFFWKDRWVVDEITERGVISHVERYDYDKQEYKRDDLHPKMIMEWGDKCVLLDKRENPDFDPKDEQYQEWRKQMQ